MSLPMFLGFLRAEIQAGPAGESLTRFDLNAIVERAAMRYLDELNISGRGIAAQLALGNHLDEARAAAAPAKGQA